MTKDLKRKTLHVTAKPGEEDRALATAIAGPHLGSAMAMLAFAERTMGDQPLTEAVDALKRIGKAVEADNLSYIERMLSSQAAALNTIFSEMALRAALNLNDFPKAAEERLRLAFKAQNQCRMTLETLATIKNPPTVFAKQANIANGPQQVVNGIPAITGARENLPAPSKLLEVSNVGMDGGTTGTATAGDTALETVGAFDGTEDADGEGTRRAEPLQGRASACAALGDARTSRGAGITANKSRRARSSMRLLGEDVP